MPVYHWFFVWFFLLHLQWERVTADVGLVQTALNRTSVSLVFCVFFLLHLQWERVKADVGLVQTALNRASAIHPASRTETAAPTTKTSATVSDGK